MGFRIVSVNNLWYIWMVVIGVLLCTHSLYLIFLHIDDLLFRYLVPGIFGAVTLIVARTSYLVR